MKCTICATEIENPTKYQKYKFKKDGRVYCCAECGKEYARRISSETMAKTNRKYASERMKKNNPMKNAITREKVSVKLKAIGHKPKIRGGNGQITIPQLLLATALGWEIEYPVKTLKKENYPSIYKIDIANPILKIGIEVDGSSHCALSRQAEDKKKVDLLNSLGWNILRFKNEEVLNNLSGCIDRVMSMI